MTATRVLTVTLLLGALVAAPRGAAAASSREAMCDSPPCTKKEIAAYENRVARHMMRVNKERFEAKYGGQPKRARRYERELQRTQLRYQGARRALETATD